MYLDSSSLALFMIATAVLLVIPGPAVMYIVARSIDQGRKAGLVSVSGIVLGGTVHVMAAVFGLSAILVASATAFNVVKYAGALYLIYLGIRALMTDNNALPNRNTEPASLRQVFTQGIIVSVLNPKTAIFFFSFLPQFARPERGHVALQFATLGLIFVGMAAVSDSIWAMAAGTARGYLRSNTKFLRRQKYFTGGTYIALGLATAMTGHRK
jgi:threonine/homoserine/homoserine lactone efflux protein